MMSRASNNNNKQAAAAADEFEALACEMHETNLQCLKGMQGDPNFIMIDLRDNELENFYGMPSLPNVQCMRFDGNRITSFLGMSFQPKLQVLTLAGNPVAEHPDYRIMAILACGANLREVDGESITRQEREYAESCGGSSSSLAQMISLGWTSLHFGGGSLGAANEEWALEKSRAEFLRYVQSVEESRTFAVIAADKADVLPLAAEMSVRSNLDAAAAGRNVTRGKISPTQPKRGNMDLYQEDERLKRRREHFEHAAAEATANAISSRQSSNSHHREHSNSNEQDEIVDSYFPKHKQQTAETPLTKFDVKSILRPHSGSNYFGASSSSSTSPNRNNNPTSTRSDAEKSKFGATQILLQNRKERAFSKIHIPERVEVTKQNALQLAREYAKAFNDVNSNNNNNNVNNNNNNNNKNNNNNHFNNDFNNLNNHLNNMNHSNNNNKNVNANVAATAAAGGPSHGPSPVSAVGEGSSSPQGGSSSVLTKVSGNDLIFSRNDILQFKALEFSPYDVSAQWQPPKQGSLQVVRATLRIVFAFNNNDENNSNEQQQQRSKPLLQVLDDHSEIVAVFTLPITSAGHAQSLWIHDGNPPAVALCSEETEGHIDVVIMPSASANNSNNSNSTSSLTMKSMVLHKALIHAMADSSFPVSSSSSSNSNSVSASPSPVARGGGGGGVTVTTLPTTVAAGTNSSKIHIGNNNNNNNNATSASSPPRDSYVPSNTTSTTASPQPHHPNNNVHATAGTTTATTTTPSATAHSMSPSL